MDSHFFEIRSLAMGFVIPSPASLGYALEARDPRSLPRMDHETHHPRSPHANLGRPVCSSASSDAHSFGLVHLRA